MIFKLFLSARLQAKILARHAFLMGILCFILILNIFKFLAFDESDKFVKLYYNLPGATAEIPHANITAKFNDEYV